MDIIAMGSLLCSTHSPDFALHSCAFQTPESYICYSSCVYAPKMMILGLLCRILMSHTIYDPTMSFAEWLQGKRLQLVYFRRVRKRAPILSVCRRGCHGCVSPPNPGVFGAPGSGKRRARDAEDAQGIRLHLSEI